jgi:hypothetical protein
MPRWCDYPPRDYSRLGFGSCGTTVRAGRRATLVIVHWLPRAPEQPP